MGSVKKKFFHKNLLWKNIKSNGLQPGVLEVTGIEWWEQDQCSYMNTGSNGQHKSWGGNFTKVRNSIYIYNEMNPISIHNKTI